MVKSKWEAFRTSGILVTVLVFCNLVSDSLLLTLVDPILPDILRNIDNQGELNKDTSALQPTNLTEIVVIQNDTTSSTSPPVFPGDEMNSTVPEKLSDFINMNGRYGILVAAKGAMQFICNPFVGCIVTRYGYRRPMLLGSIVLFATTFAFAFGDSYIFLFVTRLLQGAASSVTAVTGLGLLASTFTDEGDRGKVIGIAISGISLGVIVGPLYGSLLYEFFGQALPFLILSAMVLFAIGLQVLGFRCDTGEKDHTLSAMIKLAADPYILIVAGNIFSLNLVVAIILAFLPVRLIDLEDPATWKLGIVVLPSSIGYLLAGIIFPRTTRCLPRWLCAFIGQILGAGTLIGLGYCYTFESMLVITTFSGLAIGMVSTSMQPFLATLVDLRHSSIYGNVYAISDMSVCAAFFVGPLVGGPLMYALGFKWMVMLMGCLNIFFALLCILLRNPPTKSDINEQTEKSKLVETETQQPTVQSSNSVTTRSRARKFSLYAVPRHVAHLSDLEDNYLSDSPLYKCRRYTDIDVNYYSDITLEGSSKTGRPFKKFSQKKPKHSSFKDTRYNTFQS